MSNCVVECADLTKSYYDGSHRITVLKGINLTIHAGARVAVTGPSGSGKSTLLHLLGGLDTPTEGTVSLEKNNWQMLSEKQRCKLRNQNLGFIYQFHHLLPEFTALENVAMPLLSANGSIKTAEKRATELLGEVGLAARATHKPSELSGGERQRVAIARALVNQPKCLFADEPTGNLDYETAQQVFDVMLRLNEQMNTALVIVTHDRSLASRLDTILTLQGGVLL